MIQPPVWPLTLCVAKALISVVVNTGNWTIDGNVVRKRLRKRE